MHPYGKWQWCISLLLRHQLLQWIIYLEVFIVIIIMHISIMIYVSYVQEKKKNLQKCHEQKSKIDSKKKKSIHKRNIHLIIAKLEDNSEIIILL